MPLFSKSSLNRLSTCHLDLQILFKEVIKYCDCTVTEGFRNEADQNEAFKNGKSQKQWPDGNHNKMPSLAVDVVPYPVNYDDTISNRFRYYFFAGSVKAIAEFLLMQGKISHKVRWGGDWDNDLDFSDQKFNDFPHFELIT